MQNDPAASKRDFSMSIPSVDLRIQIRIQILIQIQSDERKQIQMQTQYYHEACKMIYWLSNISTTHKASGAGL